MSERDYSRVPQELKARPQWVCWRMELGKNGKPTKVPYDPRTGQRASTTAPATWVPFDTAMAVLAHGYSGIGYVFSEGDPYAGVDLDHCRDVATGMIALWAQAIIATLDTYTEVSPSGTGVHLLVAARVPDGGKKRGAVEMYHAERFFTVTGCHLDGTPATIEARQDEIAAVHSHHFAACPRKGGNASASTTPRQRPAASEPPIANDEALIRLAESDQKHGHDFARLFFNGDTAGYPSPSEADQALSNRLAYWCGECGGGGDPERIDRLFRRSGLMREKWDERRGAQTYGERTIATALKNRTDWYRSPASASASTRPRAEGSTSDRATCGNDAPAPDGATADEAPPSSDAPLPGTLLADVRPELVRWLWPGHIALGKLAVWDGDPGLGKSLTTADIAARVTTGSVMPDGTPGIPGGAGVVLCSAEDGLADTIRPRLEAAGADLARVLALTAVRTLDVETGEIAERDLMLPDDLTTLDRAAARVHAALIVIDPLMAFLNAKVNALRDQDVRGALRLMAGLAERSGAAVVVIRHLTKMPGGNPLYRGGGSIGIIGAARSGLLVAPDPDDAQRRILAVAKNNLAPIPPSLAYRITENDAGVPIVEWLGATEHTAMTLLAQPVDEDGRSALDRAVEWLAEALEDGPHPSDEIMRDARVHGISPKTLRSARERLNIKPKRKGFGKDGQWTWALPDNAPEGHLWDGLSDAEGHLWTGPGESGPDTPANSPQTPPLMPIGAIDAYPVHMGIYGDKGHLWEIPNGDRVIPDAVECPAAGDVASDGRVMPYAACRHAEHAPHWQPDADGRMVCWLCHPPARTAAPAPGGDAA